MDLYTTEPESHYERQLRFANEAYKNLLNQHNGLIERCRKLEEALRDCADGIEPEDAPKADLPSWLRERVMTARVLLNEKA